MRQTFNLMHRNAKHFTFSLYICVVIYAIEICVNLINESDQSTYLALPLAK